MAFSDTERIAATLEPPRAQSASRAMILEAREFCDAVAMRAVIRALLARFPLFFSDIPSPHDLTAERAIRARRSAQAVLDHMGHSPSLPVVRAALDQLMTALKELSAVPALPCAELRRTRIIHTNCVPACYDYAAAYAAPSAH